MALDRVLKKIEHSNLELESITRGDFDLAEIEPDVARWVNEIQQGRGILVLTGFPLERYSKNQCEIIYWALGSHFGAAQSQSLMGDKLGHVVNVGGKDSRERAYRNSLELALHTDASDIIGMMCLVKAKQGGLSGYCSGPAVYNQMLQTDPELVEVLMEGFFYHLFGEQAPGASPVTKTRVPIFSMQDSYLSVNYLRSYIELAFEELEVEKTELEQRALDRFDQIAHSTEFRFDFMMEPGDIAFFNNYTVLHTRTEFFDHEEPERKRHLLRLWLKAWNPRPLVDAIGPYGARKGIAKQQGRTTYYAGKAEYRESPPPKIS